MQNVKWVLLASGVILSGFATTLKAGPVLDSGRIQRDIENLNNPRLPPEPPSREAEPAPPAAQGTSVVKVAAFKIVGANRFSEKELQRQIKSYVGKTLDFDGLTQAAQTLSRYYQAQGWLAKVYLPAQTIEGGIVTLAVTEAKLGKIRLSDTGGLRLNADFLGNMLSHAQKQGAPLSSTALERTLLLINDSPGISGQAILAAGSETGETDITLSLADKPLFSARLWGDDYGTRPLGKKRLNGLVTIDNLSGFGDQLNLYSAISKGLKFGQSSYDLPVGYAGTRLIMGGAVSDYELIGGEFDKLESAGNSYSYRLGLRHPIIRSRYANLSGQIHWQAMNSKDELHSLEVSDKAYRTLTLGLNADRSDDFGLGGTFWGGISLTSGNLELLNREELAVDKLSGRLDGGYNKLNVYLGRNQQLSEKLSAKALFSTQWADTNLGGFEKFALGGPFGLSGYAVGEAAADEGWMLNLESRYAFNQQLSASLLADAGGVYLHKQTWNGWNADNPKLANGYPLASIGVALIYQHRYYDIKISYARQVIRNPGLDANGKDIEGETSRNQIWLQIGTGF